MHFCPPSTRQITSGSQPEMLTSTQMAFSRLDNLWRADHNPLLRPGPRGEGRRSRCQAAVTYRDGAKQKQGSKEQQHRKPRLRYGRWP
jgi:hypothetical protein